KAQILSLDISDSVTIYDRVNNLPEIMRGKGMYLMTSSEECFPMVLLEAQASGLPIISYNCPTGPRNIIESGKNGILVEMDNQKSFVDTLIDLTNNETLRLRIATEGFRTVQKYLLTNVMEMWEEKIINRIR